MPQVIQRYSDINLAFVIHPIKHDISQLIGSEAVIASIKNLILTNHWERKFHPEIGSGVTALLFNNIGPITSIHIERAIREVLSNFEPRVTISSVVVNVSADNNGFDATITFFVNNITTPLVVNMFLELLR